MVTMKEVASAAGVSQAAVSYAYGRPDRLSDRQREHILQVAANLRYPGPNVVGSSLRSGKIGAVGVMIMDSLSYAFSDPSTRALLEGVTMNRRLDDLALTLIPLAHREYAANGERRAARDGGRPALRGLVDGVILHSLPDDNPSLRVLTSRGIPMVVVDAPYLKGIPMVSIEDRNAAFVQMSHLLDLGHKRIGVVAERLRPDGVKGAVDRARRLLAVEHVVRERLEGYQAACLLHGIDFNEVPVIEAGGFGREDGLWAANTLLTRSDLTAVACTSDTMALAMIEAALRSGRVVPEDLSVIGFDDAPGAQEAGLTTVRQPMVEKGRLAAEMLFRLIGGDDTVGPVLLPHELVVRRTTTSPARPGTRGIGYADAGT